MKIYLNAGFGEPLGADTLALISSLKFAGVRQDVGANTVDVLIRDLAGTGLSPLFVVPYGDKARRIVADVIDGARIFWRPEEYAIELGNEVNLRVSGSTYARWFGPIEDAARKEEPEVQLVTAGIGTTNRKALGWLEEALGGASKQAIVGYHTYRKSSEPSPYSPQEGFRSRDEELSALARVAGGRKLWNTEVGWHTAPRSRGWWIFKKKFSLSDDQVSSYLSIESWLNASHGAEVMVVYQLNDGPNRKYDQDCYGIRTLEGALKPQAYIASAEGLTLRREVT